MPFSKELYIFLDTAVENPLSSKEVVPEAKVVIGD